MPSTTERHNEPINPANIAATVDLPLTPVSLDNLHPVEDLILVVDDDDSMQDLLGRALKAQGFKCVIAKNGLEALDLFAKNHPSIVLLDAHMPGMNGFEVCEHIRVSSAGNRTAVVMVTALSDETSIQHAYQAGATDYITKPIHWTVLFSRLHRLMELAHATRLLEEQNELFRTLIDNLPDRIFIKDVQGRFMLSNAAHNKSAGVNDTQEILGKTAAELFPEALASQYDQDDQEVMQSGVPLINAERISVDLADHNKLRYMLTTKVPLRDHYGQVFGLVGISRDITERTQAQEALMQAHAELEKRVEERTAELSETNAILQDEISARKMVEEQQMALIGGLQVVVSSAHQLIACRDVDALYRQAVEFASEKLGLERCGLFLRTLDGAVGVYGTDRQANILDIHHIHYTATEPWLSGMEEESLTSSRWILIDEQPVLWNEEGTSKEEGAVTPIYSARRLIGFFINDNPISHTPIDIVKQEILMLFCSLLGNLIEQKEVEGELSQNQQHLQRITDNMLDIICQTDNAGVIEFASPSCETILGYSPESLMGQSIFVQMHPDDVEAVQNAIRDIGRAEYRYRHANSNYIWLETLSNVLFDNGLPTGYIWASRDITERIRAEQNLRELNQLKTEFLTTAAHELRTPLVAIRGFSEILLTRELEQARKQHFLTLINDQSTQLGKILDDLLDISRLEAKQQLTLDLKPMNMVELVTQVVSLFEMSPDHSLTVENQYGELPVMGDAARLSQVMKNIIVNAIKYSPQGGLIAIRLEADQHWIQVKVQDHGIGLTEEQLSHLFEKFYRADASNTAIGGTGLGLSICKLLVELHGGQLWADSTYGAGSTFSFTLPYYQA